MKTRRMLARGKERGRGKDGRGMFMQRDVITNTLMMDLPPIPT